MKFGTNDFDLFWVELGDCDIRDVCIEILGCEFGSQSRFTSRGMIFCFSYLIFGWAFYFSDRSQRVRLFEVNVIPVNNLESLLLFETFRLLNHGLFLGYIINFLHHLIK